MAFGAVRRAVIVAPHPDDEGIGAYALMRRLRRRGAEVRVVIVSDGAASHPGSVRWPPARLVRERRRESRRAMAALGIAPDRLVFLDLPDGALPGTALRLTLDRAFVRMPRADLIVGPVAGDDHADHRAVATALWTRRRAPLRLGYRVWPLGRPRGARLSIALDASMRTAKRRVVRSYRTQRLGSADAPTAMVMRAHHLRAFAGPVERFAVL